MLGNLEDYERESHSLSAGHVVRIRDSDVASRGVHAVLLLRPAVLPCLAEFGDCFTIAGRHLRFVYALFLTEEEYLFRKQHGHDALMDRFTEERRSIVIFDPLQGEN